MRFGHSWDEFMSFPVSSYYYYYYYYYYFIGLTSIRPSLVVVFVYLGY